MEWKLLKRLVLGNVILFFDLTLTIFFANSVIPLGLSKLESASAYVDIIMGFRDHPCHMDDP